MSTLEVKTIQPKLRDSMLSSKERLQLIARAIKQAEVHPVELDMLLIFIEHQVKLIRENK